MKILVRVYTHNTQTQESECVAGAQVAKMFNKDLFYGSVTEVWRNGMKKLYHVVYNDGDQEDLDLSECRRSVLLFRNSKKVDDGDNSIGSVEE